MNGKIEIDFVSAKIISDYINDEKEVVNNIVISSDSALSNLSNLPPSYFKNTTSEFNNLKEKLLKINEAINSFSYSFDSSIENYYNLENDIIDNNDYSALEQTLNNSNNKFVWGYKKALSSINRVDIATMEKYLLNKGATRIQNNVYQLNVDGIEYRYDLKNRWLYIGKTRIKCDFYLSGNYRGGTINNVVTLLGGTGERLNGPIGNEKINESISFGDNALLIVPYTGDSDVMLSSYGVVGSSHFGERVFNVSSNVTRSLIGYSEGGHVATQVVSENPNLYNNVVFVNGSTLTRDGANMVRNGNYVGFRNANVMYLETTKGWMRDGDLQQNAVINSINDLLQNGVAPGNITLISNDSNLNNLITNINLNNSMPEAVGGNKPMYTGHGKGAWDIFNNSEIINYLSMYGKGGNV